MESKSRTLEYAVWTVLMIAVCGIAAAFFWTRLNTRPSLPIYGQVQDFALTNQSGQLVTLQSLRGKVWLADVIFTRCPGPCPKLSTVMADLNHALSAYPSLRLVSLTADPLNDTPQVLSVYAQGYQAQPDRWSFLTGTKTEIHRLAIDSLKLAVVEKEEREKTAPEDLFIHSTLIVLVDEQGRLRGFFEGLEPGTSERIVAAVETLLKKPLR